MKELEELTREIREKLPRLKELSKGTVIETSEKIFEIDELMYAICDNDQIFDGFRDIWIFSDEYTIIGKDPMLNDVLEWMPVNSVFINMSGGFWKDGKIDTMSDSNNYMTEIIQLGSWDLSKPFLKDQSPELIKFLHGLINH